MSVHHYQILKTNPSKSLSDWARLSANAHHSPTNLLREIMDIAYTPQLLQRNAEAPGILQRPWRRVKKFGEPETKFGVVRRNYEIFPIIGLSPRSNPKCATIIDTGSRPSFIRNGVFYESLWKNIWHSENSVKIRDANNLSVNFDSTIELVVDIGGSIETVCFNVGDHLATQVILGCDYCHKHI